MIANYVTITRILLSVALIFFRFDKATFFIIYTISGLTDILDGYIARKTKTETKAGGKLDSIADLVFGIVIIKVLYPIIISKRIWIVWIIIIFLVRLISIFIVLKKYKTFAILHTYLNKIAGVLIFLLPYFIFTKYENVFINLSYIIATLSSIEEMCINLKSKSINQNKKSIVIK